MRIGLLHHISYNGHTILGAYNNETGSGCIEGDSISLPSSYQVGGIPIIESPAVCINNGRNRQTDFELTTSEDFGNEEAAYAALIEHERLWQNMPETAELVIEGLGTYNAGIVNRCPTLHPRRGRLTIAYTFACGALTLAPAPSAQVLI